jgi:hypothetical protein
VSNIIYIRKKVFFIFNNRFDQYDRKIIGWTLSDGMSAEQTSLAA